MTDSNSNIIDLTSQFSSSTDPLNENTCYFKAYQNLSKMCLEPYKKELEKCEVDNAAGSNELLGCQIAAQQKAFKCMMFKILSDSENYTYNHCSGENLPIGSKYTDDQKNNTSMQSTTMPSRLPPSRINNNLKLEDIPNNQPENSLRSMPQKKKLTDKIFTIFRKRQD